MSLESAPAKNYTRCLISEDEARTTVELDDMYVVQPAEALWFGQEWKDRGKPIADDFRYASNTNDEWLNIEQIKAMITPIDYTVEQGMTE